MTLATWTISRPFFFGIGTIWILIKSSACSFGIEILFENKVSEKSLLVNCVVHDRDFLHCLDIVGSRRNWSKGIVTPLSYQEDWTRQFRLMFKTSGSQCRPRFRSDATVLHVSRETGVSIFNGRLYIYHGMGPTWLDEMDRGLRWWYNSRKTPQSNHHYFVKWAIKNQWFYSNQIFNV